MSEEFSREQLKSGLEIVALIGQIIRDAPYGEIPSGHLYARLMDRFSLQAYESIISILKKSGLVSEQHHLLKWIGPAKDV